MKSNSSHSRTLSPATQHLYNKVRRANPKLDLETEQALWQAWSVRGDNAARDKLVLSHMPLAMNSVIRYRNYGINLDDMLSIANIGLFNAIEAYDPTRQARFSTCANFYVCDAITSHITKNVNITRNPRTRAYRALFYNMPRIKKDLGLDRVKCLDDAMQVHAALVNRLPSFSSVRPDEIILVDQYLMTCVLSIDTNAVTNKSSLGWHAILMTADVADSEDDCDHRLGMALADPQPLALEQVAEHEEEERNLGLLKDCIQSLAKQRDRDILIARRLHEPPVVLDELAKTYGVSRERIRQLEVRATELVAQDMKVRLKAIEDNARSQASSEHCARLLQARQRTRIELAVPTECDLGTPPAPPMPDKDQLAARMRSMTTKRANDSRGADRRREISLKAAATMRARRAAFGTQADNVETKVMPLPPVGQRAPLTAEQAAETARMRSQRTSKANQTRGAQGRRAASLKAAATIRLRKSEARAQDVQVRRDNLAVQAQAEASREADIARRVQVRHEATLELAVILRRRRKHTPVDAGAA